MLELRDLSVAIGEKEIVHGVNLTIKTGETHALFGPNGSGKTTLLMAIMGFPKYRITGGSIVFNNVDITKAPLDERARLGIGMSFQRPPVVRGVKTRDLVEASLREHRDEADKVIPELAEKADLVDFLEREVNYGFSGGEIKRSELMQLMAQKPQLILLDEPESGVDLVNMGLIGKLVNELLEKDCPIVERKCSSLIITHTGHILDYVNVRTGYVMYDGRIGCEADPHEILKTVKEKGYRECIRCMVRRF